MADTSNFTIEIPTAGGNRNSWGGILNVAIQKLDELMALAMPIGTIKMYPNTTAPTPTTNGGTWLVCDGSSKVRADYPELHTLITNTYGTYPSGTTFLLPDLRARVPVGYNTDTITGRSTRAIALGSGTETHTLVEAEIPLHDHPITDDGHIHPVTDTTHYHVGDQTGGKTGSKSLTITDDGHSHTSEYVEDWASGNSVYRMDYDAAGSVGGTWTSDSSATGISIADHDHTLATDASGTGTTTGLTGITTTQLNPDRLTTTEDQTDGDESHNNMQPYITVQYIILAKHTSF